MAATLMAGTAMATPIVSVTPTNFATAGLDQVEQINNERIKFQTKGATDIRMQQLSFGTNSTTGWHHHPGMVVVVVQSGMIELWDTDCSKKAYGPGSPNGQVFIEALPHAHQATSATGAQVYVTYVVPDGAGFRVEEDAPFCATTMNSLSKQP
ncbi:MAG TPA: hypothetical protein VF470_10330 [Sphingomicrobium sp.]|jgi:quercetin dioxygenase-like cupin family protein